MCIPESVICEHLAVGNGNCINGILTNDGFHFLPNNANDKPFRDRLYNGNAMAPRCNVEKQKALKTKRWFAQF